MVRKRCVDMAVFSVSCGGSGGHVFPGVATAQALERRGHTVRLLMAGRCIESATRFAWEGEVVNTGARELSLRPAKAIPSIVNLVTTFRRCRHDFFQRRPAALLAMGSYSSAGPVLAARRLGIPVVLHEANVVPGKATTTLCRLATAIALSFPETQTQLRGCHTVLTGLPLRRDLETGARTTRPVQSKPTLLIMGGSQGAQRINELMPLVVEKLAISGLPVHVVHLSGAQDRQRVADAYTRAGIAAEVHAFHQDMSSLYQRATLAVSRSGANSCMELALFGIPAILIPYPHAVRNHQLANAQAMARAGAADLLEQDQLDPLRLAGIIQARLSDATLLGHMGKAARNRAITGADEKLADLVEQVAVPR